MLAGVVDLASTSALTRALSHSVLRSSAKLMKRCVDGMLEIRELKKRHFALYDAA